MKRLLASSVMGVLALAAAARPAAPLAIGQPAPEIAGTSWINSAPLTLADLRGRIVLIDFWTYG